MGERLAVEVVVPFAGDDPHRLRALRWLYGRDTVPTVEPLADAGHFCKLSVRRSSDAPFVKAVPVMEAIEASEADVVVVADADVLLLGEGLVEAVDAVADGAPWAIPHRWLLRLTEAATERLYADELPDAESGGDLLDRPRVGWEGGGFVVARRETLRSVPLDRRFIGWGGEDESWALALRCLAGAPHRAGSPLLHLWHPPAVRMSRRIGSRESMKLVRRYAAARRDPARMRALIEEAR